MTPKFCPECGKPLVSVLSTYPKECSGCGHMAFRNPTTVAVGLVSFRRQNFRAGLWETHDSLLLVKRAGGEMSGHWALPGGFVAFEDDKKPCETWQEALVRELFEETRIVAPVSSVAHFCTRSVDSGSILMFGVIQLPMVEPEPTKFEPTGEVSDIKCVTSPPTDLAWDSHTEMARLFFAQIAKRN